MKYIKMFLVLCVMMFALSGCGKDVCDIAFITDEGTIEDGALNEACWNGITQFCSDSNFRAAHYEPQGFTKKDYLNKINEAVKDGADIVVCPGYMMENAVFEAAHKHKKVSFILLDGVPRDANETGEDNEDMINIPANVKPMVFAEEEAGFMAGYAAVKDGYTRLGYIGGIPEESVIQYGYGFVQGADYAAIEIGAKISIKYAYAGTSQKSDEVKNIARSFYDDGTEIIFVNGGNIINSVIATSEETYGLVIGSDVDYTNISSNVMFSVIKNIQGAVYSSLNDYYNGHFNGGITENLSVTNNGVGIVMGSAFFNKYTFSDNEAITYAFANDGIKPYNGTDIGTTKELELVNVEVEFIDNGE